MTPASWDRFFHQSLDEYKRNGHYRTMRVIEAIDGVMLTVNGRKLLQFGSNDYLGLSLHPRVREAARRTMDEFGLGAGASRLVTGNHRELHLLEKDVAEFKGTEDALVFASGFATNVGVMSALVCRDDRILSDELNHASIVDGCRLSKARLEIFPHRDVDALARFLEQPHPSGRTLVVTDGVFSMDGDIAPLRKIVPLCARHEALLVVDDAHGTGVLGATGRGTLEHLDLDHETVLQVGTFSKALGGLGGFAAGSETAVDFLRNRARSLIYSTALPCPVAGGNREALAVMREQPELRTKLLHLADRLRKGFKALGFSLDDSPTPIVPLIVGGAEATVRLSARLLERNILAPAIRPPTVPEGTSRIRFSLTALHEEEHVDILLDAIRREL